VDGGGWKSILLASPPMALVEGLKGLDRRHCQASSVCSGFWTRIVLEIVLDGRSNVGLCTAKVLVKLCFTKK
jgi:hypothetical protein